MSEFYGIPHQTETVCQLSNRHHELFYTKIFFKSYTKGILCRKNRSVF